VLIVACNERSVATTTQDGFTKARIRIIEEALDAFKTDVGRLPYTEEGLSALITAPNKSMNWRGPYIDRRDIPKDGWQHNFIYYYPSKIGHGEFDLYSPGSNGVDESGKGDDISNWQD
jgi:general secretion pathway protein G